MNVHVVPRILRAGLFAILTNPFAIVAAAVALGLLTHSLAFGPNEQAAGHAWSLQEVLQCGACFTVVTFIGVLAVGHVLVSLFIGLKGRRSARD